MELNREQIIKALECCLESEYCATCPATDYCSNIDDLMGKAFDLIKELTEENERLTEELAKSYKALDEQMNFYCSFTQSKVSNCPIDDEVAKVKPDTVREIQTRFAMHFGTYTYQDIVKVRDVFRVLDQIAKEMLKGENDVRH